MRIMACDCEGSGFKSLTTTDLKMLLNVLKNQRDEMAQGMRIAIRQEIANRTIK